jgi:molecular chaperone GrpE (heat shock protein)
LKKGGGGGGAATTTSKAKAGKQLGSVNLTKLDQNCRQYNDEGESSSTTSEDEENNVKKRSRREAEMKLFFAGESWLKRILNIYHHMYT